MKVLRYIALAGGYAITILGLVIMLIEDDTGAVPHHLVNFTLSLVFVIGGILVFYIVRTGKL